MKNQQNEIVPIQGKQKRSAAKSEVPISEKYALTVNEATVYFNIGEKRIRRLVAENPAKFCILCGSKQLIVRHKFECFLDQTPVI